MCPIEVAWWTSCCSGPKRHSRGRFVGRSVQAMQSDGMSLVHLCVQRKTFTRVMWCSLQSKIQSLDNVQMYANVHLVMVHLEIVHFKSTCHHVHNLFAHSLPCIVPVLPPLLGQLAHSCGDLLEPPLEPRSPPLAMQPLPLQPASLVEFLLRDVLPHAVSGHQTPQHSNSAHNIPPTAGVQIDRPPVRGVETWIVGERLLLLLDKRCVGRLVGERGVGQLLRHGHVAKVEPGWFTAAHAVGRTELAAKDAGGAGNTALVAGAGLRRAGACVGQA